MVRSDPPWFRRLSKGLGMCLPRACCFSLVAPAITVTAPGPPASLSCGAETSSRRTLGLSPLGLECACQASGRRGWLGAHRLMAPEALALIGHALGQEGEDEVSAVEKQGADSPGLP